MCSELGQEQHLWPSVTQLFLLSVSLMIPLGINLHYLQSCGQKIRCIFLTLEGFVFYVRIQNFPNHCSPVLMVTIGQKVIK